jgi:transposase
LDNGAFHKAKCLKIPSNIKLLFLPPYSPQLNPAEKMWKHIKRKFTNVFINDLSDLSEFFTEKINEITVEKVKTTCS